MSYDTIFNFYGLDSIFKVIIAKIVIITKNEKPNFPNPLVLDTEIGASSSYPNYLLPQFKQVKFCNYYT